MSPTHCVIPGCAASYRSSQKLKNVAAEECNIFSPRNDRTLLQWQQTVGGEIVLTKSSGICQRHFRESDIYQSSITRQLDGTSFAIRKEEASLKLGAVPCLRLVSPEQDLSGTIQEDDDFEDFENEAEYLIGFLSDCEETTNEPMSSDDDSNCNDKDPSESERESQPDSGVSERRKPMTMKERLDSIKLPTKAWFRDVYSDRIMWANWGDQYNTEVHVVLMQDLNLQVYLEHKNIIVPELDKIESVDEMSQILLKAAKLLPCIGTEGQDRSPQCTGYVWRKQASQKGPQKRRCLNCCKEYNYMNKRLHSLQSSIAKAKLKIKKARLSHASKKHRKTT